MLFKKKIDEEINLVFFNESLAEKLFQLIETDREYLKKWLPWVSFTKEVSDTKKFIKDSIVAFSSGNAMHCFIEYKREIVGIIGYNSIRYDLKKVEIGYWLGANYQGNGIITRCVRALSEYAFSKLDMEKVEISTASKNYPSQGVCKRLGFQIEGTIKNSENLDGEIVDMIVWGLYKQTTIK